MVSNKTIGVGIGVIALIMISGTFFLLLTYEEPLEDFGLAEDFTLKDENNQTVTLATYSSEGRVVVVDFIYTNCPELNKCPLSSTMLKGVQNALLNKGYSGLDFHLLSISFDWLNDGLDDMKTYSERYDTNSTVWSFLWGNETQVEQVTNAYNVYAGYPNNSSSRMYTRAQVSSLTGIHAINHANHTFMVHTMGLTIVDGQGHVRARHYSLDWSVDLVVKQVVQLIKETGGS